MGFGNDPLWKLNPHGAIALYSHKISSDYWSFKHQSFDIVCAVDGAWGLSVLGTLTGGIGGCIKGPGGTLLYVFSGKVKVLSATEAEIEAILYTIGVVQMSNFATNRVVICSDCFNAIEQVTTGLRTYAPLLDPSRNLLNSLGQKYFIHYVPREINGNADFLAKKGLSRLSLFSY